MSSKKTLAIFENFKIRRVFDEQSRRGTSPWWILWQPYSSNQIIRQRAITGKC